MQTKSAPSKVYTYSTQRPKVYSRDLLILCFAFVAVRLPFLFTVPVWEAPDENTHYWVIRFMRDYLRLPSAAEVAGGGTDAVYGSLPQFGYIPHVLLSLLTPPSQIFFYERFGSLLAGLVLLYAAFHIGKELFRGKRLMQLAVPALVVCHPQLAFMQAYATSDATTSALTAVIALLLVRGINNGINVKKAALIGALLGWAVLTKLSGFVLLPPIIAAFCLSFFINRTSVKQAAASVVAFFTIFAGTTTWWFIRNGFEFNGDFMGTRTMYRTWALAYHKDLNYHVPAWEIATSLRWWRMTFFSFWGMFGYMTKYLWRPVYLIYLGFWIASVAGLAVSMVSAWKVRKLEHAGTHPEIATFDARSAASFGCLALVLVTNLGAMIWASTGNLGGPQGRYLFISELPIVVLMIAGLYQIGGKHGSKLVISLLLFNAAVCFGSWFMLFRSYGLQILPN